MNAYHHEDLLDPEKPAEGERCQLARHVLATKTGYHGFKPVPFQEVTAERFNEWAPLFGPVESADEDARAATMRMI